MAPPSKAVIKLESIASKENFDIPSTKEGKAHKSLSKAVIGTPWGTSKEMTPSEWGEELSRTGLFPER